MGNLRKKELIDEDISGIETVEQAMGDMEEGMLEKLFKKIKCPNNSNNNSKGKSMHLKRGRARQVTTIHNVRRNMTKIARELEANKARKQR